MNKNFRAHSHSVAYTWGFRYNSFFIWTNHSLLILFKHRMDQWHNNAISASQDEYRQEDEPTWVRHPAPPRRCSPPHVRLLLLPQRREVVHGVRVRVHRPLLLPPTRAPPRDIQRNEWHPSAFGTFAGNEILRAEHADVVPLSSRLLPQKLHALVPSAHKRPPEGTGLDRSLAIWVTLDVELVDMGTCVRSRTEGALRKE